MKIKFVQINAKMVLDIEVISTENQGRVGIKLLFSIEII